MCVCDIQECSICLEKIDSYCPILNCGHVFHFECINEWKKLSKNCPNCRYSLSTLLHNKRASADDVFGNMDTMYEIIKIVFQNSILESKICIDGEYILYEIEMDEYLVRINNVNILYRGYLYCITIANYRVKPVLYCYCFHTKKTDYELRISFHTGHSYMLHFTV